MRSYVLATMVMTQTQQLLLPLTVIFTALAVGLLVRAVVVMFDREVATQADSWEFDAARRIRLRENILVYRFCEPLVDDLAAFPHFLRIIPLQRARRNLAAGAGELPWTAEEFAATRAIEGLLIATVVAYVFSSLVSTPVCVALTAFVAFGYPYLALQNLNKAAHARIDAIRRRLPYGIDLMALMMEAGAGFRESLEAVAAENHDHPLGQEFGKIHRALERGQTLRQTLTEFRDRMNQDDISEIVFSVLKAQELGTPLGQIFLTLADQMRLRRFQWAEKKAGEAETTIQYPTTLLLIACLMALVGPIVLEAAIGTFS